MIINQASDNKKSYNFEPIYARFHHGDRHACQQLVQVLGNAATKHTTISHVDTASYCIRYPQYY